MDMKKVLFAVMFALIALLVIIIGLAAMLITSSNGEAGKLCLLISCVVDQVSL